MENLPSINHELSFLSIALGSSSSSIPGMSPTIPSRRSFNVINPTTNRGETTLKIFADDKESYFEKEIINIEIDSTEEKQKELIGYVIMLKNITFFKELDSAKTNFIATISHELKTPITIISGQLEGMIYNIGKYKDRDTYLKKSYESTQELKTLVEEMIQVSKYEILERPSQTKEIDLLELINRLLKRQTYLIEEKEITVNVYGEENFTIEVDEERITKAISNIINNGIKYSPNNSELNIRLLNKDKKILEIQNTGTTIDEKLKDKIFKPFFRVEKSRNRKTGGSGLGLYIVSQVLKEYNFKYNIKNRKDSVVFTIEFSDK